VARRVSASSNPREWVNGRLSGQDLTSHSTRRGTFSGRVVPVNQPCSSSIYMHATGRHCKLTILQRKRARLGKRCQLRFLIILLANILLSSTHLCIKKTVSMWFFSFEHQNNKLAPSCTDVFKRLVTVKSNDRYLWTVTFYCPMASSEMGTR